MPAAPPAPPPTAAPPPAAAPAAPAASTTPAINVSSLPMGGPTAPPKPGSARERLFQQLQKKAGQVDDPPAAPKPTSPVEQPKPASPEPGEETPLPPGSTPEEAPEAPATTEGGKKEKVSPWKLVDQYKAKLSALEKTVAEYKTKGIPPEIEQQFTERVTKAEQRAKELEDEIRYVNYSKSEEFQNQYQKPYEEAWHRAMADLKELTIEDPSSQQRRPVSVDDIVQLVNLPLGQAREVADSLFGKFSDDVMQHRKEIKNLFEKQNVALEEAKKTGAQREQQRMEQRKNLESQLGKYVGETWQKANELLANDEKYGKFFKPVEGDEQGNQRLAKGYELVDRGFGENPNDPRLKPEERAGVIKRHAAIRNRAAAFGRLAYQNEQKDIKIAELTKQLEQFSASEPGTTGGQRTAPNGSGQSTARQSMFDNLRKLAK